MLVVTMDYVVFCVLWQGCGRRFYEVCFLNGFTMTAFKFYYQKLEYSEYIIMSLQGKMILYCQSKTYIVSSI